MVDRSEAEFAGFIDRAECASVPGTIAGDSNKQALGFAGRPDAVAVVMHTVFHFLFLLCCTLVSNSDQYNVHIHTH